MNIRDESRRSGVKSVLRYTTVERKWAQISSPFQFEKNNE